MMACSIKMLYVVPCDVSACTIHFLLFGKVVHTLLEVLLWTMYYSYLGNDVGPLSHHGKLHLHTLCVPLVVSQCCEVELQTIITVRVPDHVMWPSW